MVLLPN